MKPHFVAALGIMLFFLFTVSTAMAAVDFNQPISPQDEAQFDQILDPVMKIYSLIKYLATAIAALVLLIAGISYITSGSNPGKRENSKSMVMYVVIGLVIIWAAPLLVNFIVT